MTMFHDKEVGKAAERELFSLGEGQIGYVRQLRPEELGSVLTDVAFNEAWGVFSARGEILAVCDSPAAAWSFFADHQLRPVSIH